MELSFEHNDKTDSNTLGLVRQIAELAILKHGDLARDDDVAPSSEVRFKDVLAAIISGFGGDGMDLPELGRNFAYLLTLSSGS